MAEQFIHKYELEFGQPISFYSAPQANPSTIIPINTTPSKEKVASRISSDTNAVKLTQHNISFRILKGKDSSTTNEIVIYNISDNVRKFLEANNGHKPLVILRAGYESDIQFPIAGQLPILFSGEVVNCVDTFNGVTRTTTLTVASGTTAIQEAYSVKSYRKGTTGEQIVRDVIADLKLPEGTIYIPDSMFVGIQKPVSYTGPSMEFLRKLGKDNGFKVFVEDGAVSVIADDLPDVEFVPSNNALVQQILQNGSAEAKAKTLAIVEAERKEFRKKYPRRPVSVFEISAETNMIGSPSVNTADASQTQNIQGSRQNVTVTTTLNGAYTIGAKVNLRSKYHSGVYEIVSITHSGTYEGTDWQSSLELKPNNDYELEK